MMVHSNNLESLYVRKYLSAVDFRATILASKMYLRLKVNVPAVHSKGSIMLLLVHFCFHCMRPLKNIKAIGFLSNTGSDPLKSHKATKQTFMVGASSARHGNVIGVSMASR